MLVYEVMGRNAERIHPDATLREAAGRMKERDAGILMVCDYDQLIGVVTDRDIAVRAVSAGYDPRVERVETVMTADVLTCYQDQDASEVADLMRALQVHRMPVLDRDGQLVGVVSLEDLVIEIGEEVLAGDALEGVAGPA